MSKKIRRNILPKPDEKLTKRQLIEILIVCMTVGILLLIYDYRDARINFNGVIKRNDAGFGNITQDLELEFLGETKDYTVEVSERGLSDEEVEAKFKQAVTEIENTYLGKNKSANKVMYDLLLNSNYADGLIDAFWRFDKYGYISGDGKLNEECITDAGEVINITAELSYEENTQLYSFSVVVYPPDIDTPDGQLYEINKAVKAADKETKDQSLLVLPKEVGTLSLKWKKKMNYRGLHIIILGIAAVCAVFVGQFKEEEKKRKKIIANKEQDYPLIVSELSILLSAGMSFRKALERIILKYDQRKKEGLIRDGYEDMAQTYRKIADGMGEIAALEDLGQKSESKEYRKLAMLLIQNLKKGSKDLIDSLEKEEKYAFEIRKQRAIRAGEEASTKLLIPMAGMLFIVIVILMVPAILQMNI